jgi:NAD-dependent DNA ligase
MKVFTTNSLRDGQLVAHFLMASYLYYHEDISPIPDTEFDQLCVRLLAAWDDIVHPHKKLIKKADLEAGSGFAIPLRKYPLIVRSASFRWADSLGITKE